MKKRKIILLMLTIILLTIIFGSCANDDEKEVDMTQEKTDIGATSDDENIPGESTAANILDNIPSEDYAGYEFTFLKYTHDLWATSDIIVEEETGNAILDAMYRRNKKIEEKFNIKLTETIREDPSPSLRRSVTAGDYEFDAVYDRSYNVAALSPHSILYNLPDIPNIDLNNPWWDSSAIKDLTISGKLYIITGDANLHYNDATWIIMFNKNMISDFALENPYQLVLDGKWTLDKFYELMSAVSADLNGNGENDFDDRYGFLSHNATYNPFMFGFDEKLFAKDNNDLPVIALNSANFTSKCIKIGEIMANKNMTAIWERDKYLGSDEWEWQNVFFDGRALFFAEVLGTLHLSNMRNMQENFGLLPLPKYDVNQTEYISTVLETTVALGIPANAENPGRTGLILEAFSAESYSSVIPAYYDVALQHKLTRDEESVKMLDIIRKVRRYDLGGVYGFGSVARDITNMLSKNETNIVSYIEKVQDKVKKSIDLIVEAYTE